MTDIMSLPQQAVMEVAANNFMGEESEESFMYDSNLLRDLNFSGLEGAFKNRDVSPANPGPGLKIRSLGTEDYDRGNCSIQVLIQFFTHSASADNNESHFLPF